MVQKGKNDWMETSKNVGKRLDSLIYQRRIKFKDFADGLGVTPRTLYDFRYKGVTDINVIAHAATLLDVDIQFLLADDEEVPFFIATATPFPQSEAVLPLCCFCLDFTFKR